MDQTVNTGAIAQGFAALAQALAPNYQGMIEADLARYRRDNIAADTGYRNALTGKTTAETSGITADNAAEAAMRVALQSGQFDPATLGAVFAGVGTDPQGMAAMPGFVTGYRTTMDPSFVASPTFSSVLAGTGVQPYQNTPGGVADALGNAVTLQGMQNENAVALQGLQNDSALAIQNAANQGAIDVQGASNRGELNLQNDQQAFAVRYPNIALGRNGLPAGGGNATNDPLDVQRAVEIAKMVLGGDKAPPNIAAQVAADAMEMVRRGLAPDLASAVTQLAPGYLPAQDPWGLFNKRDASYTNPLGGVLAGAPAAAPAPAAPAAAAPTPAGTVTVGGQTYSEGDIIKLRDGREFTVQGGQVVQTK